MKSYLSSIAIACLLVVVQGAAAAPQTLKLQQIKAAFVLNIAKFVTWPTQVYQQRPSQLLLCYYRRNSLGSAFETIRGKAVEGRRLKKMTVDSLSDSGACDILLVPSDALQDLESEARLGFELPVLTIADMTDHDTTGVPYKGVLVSLVRQGARIGFEVNLGETRKAGLKVSSELLKLATIVGSES